MADNNGLLRKMITGIVLDTIRTRFHHMETPSNLYVKVVKVTEKSSYYEYSVKVLDSSRNIDSRYPEIPRIKCRKYYETGTVLIALSMNGELDLVLLEAVTE